MSDSTPDSSQEILDSISFAAEAARRQVLQIAQTASEFHQHGELNARVEALASCLQTEAVDVQLRLQAIQDAAVKLGAMQPQRTSGPPIPDLHPIDIPAARRLLYALSSVTEAARALDEEMGWLDDEGRPIGYYERYALSHILFRTDLLEKLEQSISL